MTAITPFNPNDENIKFSLRHILYNAPVKNLTEDEVMQTLRLLHLQSALHDDNPTSRFSVTVWKDDARLANCTDEDRFLALLLDADCRDTILSSKRCCYCFAHNTYYWRKVAGQCVLITTKSATVEGQYGGRFFGRGWVLAPNIKTLRKWIVSNSNNSEISKLKV